MVINTNSRTPPHSQEAERSVISAILIDPEAIALIVSKLRPDHFYIRNLRFIYESMVELYNARQAIDVVTVSEQLKKHKRLTQIGGRAFLAELAGLLPTAAHIEDYAVLIKEFYLRRKLIEMSSKLTERAFDTEDETKQLLDKAESMIFSLSQESVNQDFVQLRDLLTDSFDRLDELHKNKSRLRGLETGFTDLDKRLSGLQKNNLLILAARPGQGKTALALNIAHYASVVNQKKVGFFSLEMSHEELVDRLLVSQSDIDAWRLKTGNFSEDDWQKLTEAISALAEAPLYIDDTPGISILEMRTKARRLQAEKGLDLIVVDYLQLIKPRRRFESRVQEVSYISQELKNLAREIKVPVLALSQLSRAVEHRGGNRPQLADLRESGAIEQDADVVIFLYKEEESDEEENTYVRVLEIAKHRNGPVGYLKLLFKNEKIKFYNYEGYRDEDEDEEE